MAPFPFVEPVRDDRFFHSGLHPKLSPPVLFTFGMTASFTAACTLAIGKDFALPFGMTAPFTAASSLFQITNHS